MLFFIWSAYCLYFPAITLASSDSNQRQDMAICPKPPVWKTDRGGVVATLNRALRGMASVRSTQTLAHAFERLLLITWGQGHKQVHDNYFRRSIRNATRLLNKNPNQAVSFDHPRDLLFYGLVRLENRPLHKIEKHCFEHDTYKSFNFAFVQSSFIFSYPRDKPCENTMYTELRRKVMLVDLHYPFITTFRRFDFMIGTQRVGFFAWQKASDRDMQLAMKDPDFRYHFLIQRKKWSDSPELRNNREQLLKQHQTLIEKEMKIIQHRLKDVDVLLGGYMFIYADGSRPAYFGYIQMATVNSMLNSLLNTAIGRRLILEAHDSNMGYLIRK